MNSPGYIYKFVGTHIRNNNKEETMNLRKGVHWRCGEVKVVRLYIALTYEILNKKETS